MWKYEQEFRIDKPETVGETDKHFDLDNYKDWLEEQLTDCRKQLSIQRVVGRSEQLKAFNEEMNIRHPWYMPVPEEEIEQYTKSL